MSANVSTPFALGAPMAISRLQNELKRLSRLSLVELKVETRNSNLEMVAPFTPRNLTSDKISLHEDMHTCTAPLGKLVPEILVHLRHNK